MELPALDVLVRDPFLQSLHVTVGDSIKAYDQSPGERGDARQWETLEGQPEKKDRPAHVSAQASWTTEALAKNHEAHSMTGLNRHVQHAV
jgi:hypothetical protein